MKQTRYWMSIGAGLLVGAVITLAIHATVGIIRFWLGV